MPIVFRTTGTLARPSLAPARLARRADVPAPITCAIVERPDGLLLIDTGWSRAQAAWTEHDPGRIARAALGLRVRAEDALASQLISLGKDPGAVRHIVATQLHRDHIGGAADFPAAVVHTTAAEWAARQRGWRAGYAGSTDGFAARVRPHTLAGPAALGFPASHDLFGDGTVLLLDARGCTVGALAVAVKLAGDTWLVHAGDACFTREEYLAPPRATARPAWLDGGGDAAARARTMAALRTAEREHGARVVPSHDATVYGGLPTTFEAALRAAWDGTGKKPKPAGNAERPRPPRTQGEPRGRARSDAAPEAPREATHDADGVARAEPAPAAGTTPNGAP